MDDLCNKLICTRNENLFDVEDIIINILSRLPVKSLMICKSVSKQWWSEHFLTKIDGETTETLPGIRCISIRTSLRLDIHIRNPATREVLLLPQSRGSKESPKIGVAFYPRTNEYKVFQFFNPAGKSHDKHSECEVYSSITGCWKGIVDMEENFSVIGIPEEATLHTFLVSFEGCLSLVAGNVFDKNRFDMWILQDTEHGENSTGYMISERGFLFHWHTQKASFLAMDSLVLKSGTSPVQGQQSLSLQWSSLASSVGFATREEQFRWLLLARSLWELPVKVYMLTEGRKADDPISAHASFSCHLSSSSKHLKSTPSFDLGLFLSSHKKNIGFTPIT
ncbi:hypothetical protein CK203_029907 [Vitis vinifera]|uniref:F-box domain-containing protein n=1 Tax=Vitis vinifera TaxID=29760 RepID=A0A438IDI6_VITVI|nr:hypothetical protein CK203_029907 [Vitis vinifera]